MSVIYVPVSDPAVPVRSARRSSSPSVSVVVASCHERVRLEKGLDLLVPIALAAGAEVLVVRADPPARLADLARVYTGVRFVVAAQGSTRSDLMAFGMSESSGHVVILTDDSRVPVEDWDEMLAHRGGVLRPGSGIARDINPESWLDQLKQSGVSVPDPVLS